MDEHGLRMRLIDWGTYDFVGLDFFAPWESVASAMIAGDGYDMVRFLDTAGDLEVWWNNLYRGRECAEEAVRVFCVEKGR